MKKQIKLYLHHDHFEPLTYKKKVGFFKLIPTSLLKGLEFVGNGVLTVCYAMGWIILNIVLLPKTIYNLFRKLPDIARTLKLRLHQKTFRRAIAGFAVVVILMTSGIHGLTLIAIGQNIKGEVLETSDAGLGYLQDAKNSLEAENTGAAQANFHKALEAFKDSRENLNNTSTVLRGLLAVVPQKQDADKLIEAAEKITEAALKGTELLDLTATTKLSAVGMNAGDKNKEILERAKTLVDDSVELANEATKLINEVSISSIPENYRTSFIAAKDTANFFQSNISSLKEVSALMFDLLLGQKNTLIVFANNNELRANGGFIGTVGSAKMNYGTLDSLDIRSVYDWDGQLKEQILPPQPLYAVNNRWYLRDSNWFASFPDSASRISSFFEKEGGETPDLIVLMTPEVIIDMLDRTGPITLPQYGVSLDKDNFVELSQTQTSINYDKTLNQPKQFLADFFPLLMEKLGNTNNGGIMGFLEIFQQNLYRKQIVLYSRDADIQDKISAFNWGGEVRNTNRDYLSVINSNLGGTKTDRSLIRSTNLVSKISDDGIITNTLEYVVKNPLPNSPGLSNKSFVRFYVPQGSTLLSSEGFDNTVQLPQISPEGYILDEKVSDWQKSVKQDISTGMYSGVEAGKTWFGNWLEVGGNQTKTITLTYTLPFKLGKVDRHSLLIQKQAGSQADNFSYEIDFTGRRSLWKSPSLNLENSRLKYSQDLLADTFIGTVLEK